MPLLPFSPLCLTFSKTSSTKAISLSTSMTSSSFTLTFTNCKSLLMKSFIVSYTITSTLNQKSVSLTSLLSNTLALSSLMARLPWTLPNYKPLMIGLLPSSSKTSNTFLVSATFITISSQNTPTSLTPFFFSLTRTPTFFGPTLNPLPLWLSNWPFNPLLFLSCPILHAPTMLLQTLPTLLLVQSSNNLT